MASSEQAEVNRRAQAVHEAWLRANIAFERTSALLVSSRTLIDESRALLTTLQTRKTDAPVASSRAVIDDSRQLLTALQHLDVPPTPLPNSSPEPVTVSRSDGASVNSAAPSNQAACIAERALLSVSVFQEGLDFSWTLKARNNEMLGHGTAETERQARIDAFGAGMTYIDRAKGRSSPSDTSLH